MAGRVNELLAELRGCGETLDCRGCKRANSPVLCQSLVAEAADMLQEYVDRCARYAEEIAVLRQTNEDLRGTVLRRDVQIKKMKEENNGTTDEEN